MKILLLGEHSSIHYNLKDGLMELGHEVHIASNGDGWKNIPRDIDINYRNKWINSKLANRLYPWIDLKKFVGYDLVQIISPDVLFKSYFPSKLFFQVLKKFNKKIFLLGAGSDAYFWKYGRNKLRYGPFEDTLKYDLKSDKHPSEKKEYVVFNEYIADLVDGIIPVMKEYEICYNGHKKLLKTIPMPINTKKIKYEKNIINNKLVIFHGLSRYGFKGTRYVEEAFRILKTKHPNDLELIIDGRLPLKKYLKLIKKTNILIDQTSFYSVGVNGLYAMAMGKVTLGGAELESLKAFGVNSTPCINITPSVRSIVEAIEALIKQKDHITKMGLESRRFIEDIHGHVKVAQKYIDAWGQ